MTIVSRECLAIALLAALGTTSPARLSAQPPPSTPTTVVMTSLTIKTDADRSQVVKAMPDEVRATVKLYLDGRIQQWYARSDGRGVVFILNCSTVAEARTLMEELPLSKAGLATLEFTPLGPLTPLRALLAAPPGTPASDR
jgi:hypothetical protein